MKLSIITINFNNRDGLRKTIDSVVSQTWQDFEWIIVDGGSTDGSKELIEETASKLESQGWTTEQFSGPEDPASYIANHQASIINPSSFENPSSPQRLLWCSEKDKGIYNAMNKGIAKARGEYMNFMNSGDIFYDKDVLERVFSKEYVSDLLYGDWLYWSDKIEYNGICPKNISIVWLSMHNICHQAIFIKSRILREEGYDENYKLYADWARWMKLACKGGVFEYIPYTICRYEMGGISSQSSLLADNERAMIKELPPPIFRNSLQEYIEVRTKLYEYERCIITNEALSLIKERPLYSKIIHCSVISVKILRRVLNKMRELKF